MKRVAAVVGGVLWFVLVFFVTWRMTFPSQAVGDRIKVEYLPMREERRENFATVRTLIPRDQGEGVEVNYRLHCRRNVWKLFDVSIAGVSMVTTYRTAFSAEVRKSGVEGLIQALEQKNEEVGA